MDQIMEAPRTACQHRVDMDLGNNRGHASFREKKPFRKRNGAALEGVEQKCLVSLREESMQLFRNIKLKSWPHHFDTAEQCGEELERGLMLLWSSYLVVETLLIAIAIQPLLSPRGQMASPDYKVFGLLWMLSLLCDSMGLAVTAVFLGYLLSVPGKLTWIWVCRLGLLRDLPSLILVSNTLLNLLATGYTVWTLYGTAIGFLCLFIGVSCVGIGLWIYVHIRNLEVELAGGGGGEEKVEALRTSGQPAARMLVGIERQNFSSTFRSTAVGDARSTSCECSSYQWMDSGKKKRETPG